MNKIAIFAILMVCQLICCFALSVISPFFPPYARTKGISEEVVGIIFISNPFGAVIASVLLGKILNERNRFQFMVSGLFIQSLALYLFAVTNYQDSATWIIITAVVARFINGFASSTFITPLYAFLPLLFPESIEQKMSIAESFASLGFLIGPAAGSLLYAIGGYLLPFIFFGTMSLVLVPPIGYYFNKIRRLKTDPLEPLLGESAVPTALNKNQAVYEEDGEDEEKQDSDGDVEHGKEMAQLVTQEEDELHSKPLNYSEVLTSYPIVMVTMCAFTVNFMFNYFAPITADFFEIKYGSTPTTIGYYLTIMPFTYIINSVILANYSQNKTLQMFIGSVIMGIAPFFVGPDTRFTGVERNLYVCFLAMGIEGFAAAYLYIFTVPVLNDYLTARYPKRPIACANMASALFNSGIYLGELASPPISGLMVKYFGYDRAYSILGMCILVFSVFYFPVLFYAVPTVDLRKSSRRTATIIASKHTSSLIAHI